VPAFDSEGHFRRAVLSDVSVPDRHRRDPHLIDSRLAGAREVGACVTALDVLWLFLTMGPDRREARRARRLGCAGVTTRGTIAPS